MAVKYPSLEAVSFYGQLPSFDATIHFLRQNHEIIFFQWIRATDLVRYEYLITDIYLDTLNISYIREPEEFAGLCLTLNHLYNQQMYKHLFVDSVEATPEQLELLSRSLKMLQKVSIESFRLYSGISNKIDFYGQFVSGNDVTQLAELFPNRIYISLNGTNFEFQNFISNHIFFISSIKPTSTA